jgi:ferredoxin-NADP reductase
MTGNLFPSVSGMTSTDKTATRRMKIPVDRMAVRLSSLTELAQGTKLYEFTREDGASLPAATAGSHIDVYLPNGLTRQYSLILDSQPSPIYAVAVKDDPTSRGGSRFMHHELRVGAKLEISSPRNHFPLTESAEHTVLIAGGIGITPILSMLNRLKSLGRSFELHYACRARKDMAFFEQLQGMPLIDLHLDLERGGILDLDMIRRNAPTESHFYCCGPLPMLEAFERSTHGMAENRVHVEYFSPKQASATKGGFAIELARTKRTLFVKPGQRIIDVLLAAGVNVPMSCEQGICGSCETRVLAGTPDHRDQILTEAERRDGKSMMVCCSGSLSECLVLDI